MVIPASIIVTWGIGDKYHPPYINIPIDCIYLPNRKDITGPEGVICSFYEEEVV